MIEGALRLIRDEVDQALRLRAPGPSLAVLSGLTDASGAAIPEATDKLAVFLVNVEREASPVRGPRWVDGGQDRLAALAAPLHLNLLVMFAANFSGANYNEGLKLIAGVAAFFQSRPVFTHLNTPALHPDIERLSMEMETLSITDLSNLWGVLGGRYVPSVLYRMRLLSIDGEVIERQPTRVERPLTQVVPGPGT
jgi:hypothetical protein